MGLFDFEDEIEDFEDSEIDGAETEVGALLDSKTKRSFRVERNDGFEIEDFGVPVAEASYAAKHNEDTRDAYEYHRKKEIAKLVDVYYRESEVGQSLEGKEKIPTQNYSEIYSSIRGRFETGDFSESDIFIAICEHFCLPSYDTFYLHIPLLYKEALVKEMDEKYGKLKRKNKLF